MLGEPRLQLTLLQGVTYCRSETKCRRVEGAKQLQLLEIILMLLKYIRIIGLFALVPFAVLAGGMRMASAQCTA